MLPAGLTRSGQECLPRREKDLLPECEARWPIVGLVQYKALLNSQALALV